MLTEQYYTCARSFDSCRFATHPRLCILDSFVHRLAHSMEEAFFENNRVDAVAMERLTASPWVVNIYALCGMSMVTEYAGKELADMAKHLNASQRLDLAVQVAQGLADVHSIDGGNDNDTDNADGGQRMRPSLVHNDVNLANLRMTPDNRPVLNDFNIAILLMKHNETGETCPFASHFPNPQWRGPEEQVNSEYESDTHPPIVTEKIDIYALGNVFYRLAVGASPWKRPGAKKVTPEEKVVIAGLKRTNGTLPAIPDDIVSSPDPAVQALLQAMYSCYQFDPRKRPTAAQVVTMLSRSSASIRAGSDGRRLSRKHTWW
jgi:serine/threonine protein kinase